MNWYFCCASFLFIVDNKGQMFNIYSMTTLERIKETLAQLKPELADKYGVNSIGLFGSVVRDDFTPSSDIDIIVDFNRPIGIEFVDMADYIEQVLMQPVDVVSRNGIKPKYLKVIEPEIIYV